MEDERNPYAAPASVVEDVAVEIGDSTLLDEPRVCPARAGKGWLGRGWELFKPAWGMWIGLVVALGAIMIVGGLIPVVGGIATNLLWPVFSAGLMIGCRVVDEGGELEFTHLFAGFRRNTGGLIGLGALYIAFLLGIGIVIGGTMFGVMAATGSEIGEGRPDPTVVLVMVLAITAATIPLMMMYWFAPALIALNDVPVFRALKLSFVGCLRNWLPFLLYGLLAMLLAILASIPLGLGFLILGPVLIGSQYAGYREIFTRE